jgi:hypothetical protein
MPDQDGESIVQMLAQAAEVKAAAILARGDHVRNVQCTVELKQVVGGLEIGLGEYEQGGQASVVRRDQAPVEEPWAWLGIGQRGDDHQLVSIGDNDALDWIGIIRTASKRGRPRFHSHDARQRVWPAGEVTHDRNLVTHDHALTSDITRLDCVDLIARLIRSAQDDRESTTIDCGDEPLSGILVTRTLLASWSGLTASGSNPDVVLI